MLIKFEGEPGRGKIGWMDYAIIFQAITATQSEVQLRQRSRGRIWGDKEIIQALINCSCGRVQEGHKFTLPIDTYG